MWLTNNNTTIQYVERSQYSPMNMGYSIDTARPTLERAAVEEPEAGQTVEADGVIEAENEAQETAVEAENAEIDAADNAAVESFENEGGNLGDTSDSSSDSGSSDSGGE